MMNARDTGYALIGTNVGNATLGALRDRVFVAGEVGKRCLLDEPIVRQVAIELRQVLEADGHLSRDSRAIQAIAFDKTPDANWKVTWHQDVMFPFAQMVTRSGFDLSSRKEGVDYARPPASILEEMLAVRLHLDDCDDSNGPLRVSPGSHRYGILRSAEIPDYVARYGEAVCTAREGDALLMKPLLLHASSPAINPQHRRVIHIVYHSGMPIAERWHRAV
ncbi:MAG TPA: phytanoyl-CoA dioxygenase family protein [Opitutaceae bacterium]|nr:phytanoyl-CoA dioxygenase family protein [Opitutaceae bacterium]